MFAYEKQRTFNVCCRASSKNDVRLPHGLQKSAAQIETTLHVVDSIAVGLECRLIAKLGWPDVGIVWMSHVPADPSFADAALQIRNVCWPAAVFAVFLAAPGRQILGRLCFVSSTHQPSPRTRAGRLILQR